MSKDHGDNVHPVVFASSARAPGRSVQDVLRAEARDIAPPPHLLEESYTYLGSEDIPVERYTSKEFARLEAERLWPKVWQMACREEDIPEVGDFHVYDIAKHSIIVVRVAPNEIKAYYNSCLHRGTALCEGEGRIEHFRCPFHGWSWNLDGSVKRIPSKWDFPHVRPSDAHLPEVRVATWQRFVFVNMDPNAEPLDEYIGILNDHFQGWGDLSNRVVAVHGAKVVNCNWKVAVEAFLETYHVRATHPNLSWYNNDENTQYDIYGDNVSRFISLIGMPTPQAGDVPADFLVRTYAEASGFPDPESMEQDAARSGDARETIERTVKALLEDGTGIPMESLPRTAVVDAISYFLFPNFSPWPVIGVPILYRFRPYGEDPDFCILETMLMKPVPPGAERPAPAKAHWVKGESFSEVPGAGAFAPVVNQDLVTLPRVQAGLKASRKGTVSLSNYQEIRIRQFHNTLMKYMG